MSGPIYLNQVISQTPHVEKVHLPDHQHPEAMQRQIILQQQEQLRINTETVPTAVKSEGSREVEKEPHEKGRSKAKKKPALYADQSENPLEPSPDEPAGGIVDLVI